MKAFLYRFWICAKWDFRSAWIHNKYFDDLITAEKALQLMLFSALGVVLSLVVFVLRPIYFPLFWAKVALEDPRFVDRLAEALSALRSAKKTREKIAATTATK